MIARPSILLFLLAAPISTALAQDVSSAPRQVSTRTVREVLQALSLSAEAKVLADSGLSGEKTAFVLKDVTNSTLEAALDALVKTLPPGAAWAKVYLPDPPIGKKYTGDALAQYVMAQAALFGKAGASVPGKVELLGRQITPDEAEPMLAGLKLKPYYVVSAPRRSPLTKLNAPGAAMDVMGALTKQLGVADVKDIPPGTYKVSLPGPDGVLLDGQVTIEDDGSGNRRVMVNLGKSGGGG